MNNPMPHLHVHTASITELRKKKKSSTHVKYSQFGGPVAPPFSVKYVGSKYDSDAKLKRTIASPDSVI
jgi:hypothetical protein